MLSPYSGRDPIKDGLDDMKNKILSQSIMYKIFDKHGYCVMNTEKIENTNPKEHMDLVKYAINIKNKIGSIIVKTNETLTIDEFIEFKKSTLLKITRKLK
jgi:hypothetical protein